MGQLGSAFTLGGVTWAGFTFIAGLTWYFSTRPRQFVWLFVPRDEARAAYRVFLRDSNRKRGLRQMAVLQFAVGTVAAVLAWLSVWFG
jgi:hypothetical protein